MRRGLFVAFALALGFGAGTVVGVAGFAQTKTTARTYSTPVRTVISAKQTARTKHLETELATVKVYLATDQARAVELENASETKKRTASTRPSGVYGGQTKAENEEAGCEYGFTVSHGVTHCDTQEEGIRIQEANRREREDPQREAENERIGAEDQSHEECVVRLGVNAC